MTASAEDQELWREAAARGEASQPVAAAGCLDENSLAGLLEGRLPADEEEVARAHLLGCARCREAIGRVGLLHEEATTTAPRARARVLVVAAVLLLAVGAGVAMLLRRGLDATDAPGRLVAAARDAAGFEPLDSAALLARPREVERGGVEVLAPRGAVLSGRPELDWDAVPGATSYRATVRGEDGVARLDATVAARPLPWPKDVAPLAAGGRFVAKVRALTPAGEVAGSEAFRVLSSAEFAAYEKDLAAVLSRAPEDLRGLVAAHLAARAGLWAEAHAHLVKARAEGAPSKETADLQALVDHHLGRSR
jgi:hypothetical protein